MLRKNKVGGKVLPNSDYETGGLADNGIGGAQFQSSIAIAVG